MVFHCSKRPGKITVLPGDKMKLTKPRNKSIQSPYLQSPTRWNEQRGL